MPNRHIKTIARPERIIGFDNAHMPAVDGKFTDLLGNAVHFERHGVLNTSPDYSGGKLHHYFTRSWEDWLRKVARGYNGGSREVSEFELYDLNDIYDDGALRLREAVQDMLI